MYLAISAVAAMRFSGGCADSKRQAFGRSSGNLSADGETYQQTAERS